MFMVLDGKFAEVIVNILRLLILGVSESRREDERLSAECYGRFFEYNFPLTSL
jgi:hypothetical protein